MMRVGSGIKQIAIVLVITLSTILLVLMNYSSAMSIDYEIASSSHFSLLINAFMNPNNLSVKTEDNVSEVYVDDSIVQIDNEQFTYKVTMVDDRNSYLFYEDAQEIGEVIIDGSDIEFRSIYENFPTKISGEDTSNSNYNEIENSASFDSNHIKILASITHTYHYFTSFIWKFILFVGIYLLSIVIMYMRFNKNRGDEDDTDGVYSFGFRGKFIVYILIMSFILFLILT